MQIRDEDKLSIADHIEEQIEETSLRELVLEKVLIGLGMIGSFFAHEIWLGFLILMATSPVLGYVVAAAASLLVMAAVGFLFKRFVWKRIQVKRQVSDLSKDFTKDLESSEDHKDAYMKLKLGTEKFKEAKNEAKAEVKALYERRSEDIAVDVQRIEETDAGELDHEIEQCNTFLTNMLKMFGNQRFAKEESVEFIDKFNQIAELVDGKIQVKPDAQLLKSANVDEDASRKIHELNKHFHKSASSPLQFVKAVEADIQKGKFTREEVRNLVKIALNRAIVYQAVQNDTLVEKVLNDGSATGQMIGNARNLQKILASDFSPKGKRCETYCELFYGKPVISSKQYQDLFVMLNTASNGKLSEGMQLDDMYSDEKIIKAINQFSFDGLAIHNAVNMIKQMSVVASRSDAFQLQAVSSNDLEFSATRAEARADEGVSSPGPHYEDEEDEHPHLPF